MRHLRTIVVALAIGGCVSTELEPDARHPANPTAPVAATAAAPSALAPGFDPFEAYPDESIEAVDHSEHAGHGHAGHDPEPAPAADETYVCPMHPEVKQEGPGRCPKCGMKLVPHEKVDAK